MKYILSILLILFTYTAKAQKYQSEVFYASERSGNTYENPTMLPVVCTITVNPLKITTKLTGSSTRTFQVNQTKTDYVDYDEMQCRRITYYTKDIITKQRCVFEVIYYDSKSIFVKIYFKTVMFNLLANKI